MLTTAASWTSGARVLITLGAELAARGDIVTVACLSRSALERSVEATFPRLPVRGIAGQGAFARIGSARGIVAALRPDALLVQRKCDSVLAAMATRRRGGVVCRWSVGENAPDRQPAARTWPSRLAGSRTRLTSWGRDPIAVSWPGPSSRHVRVEVPSGEAILAALWILPAGEPGELTAVALRAAGRLVGRHPLRRIVLRGELAALHHTRKHAASLGLTAFVQVAPIDTPLRSDEIDAAAVWVTADGDDGPITTIAAMQHGIPVVVPAALSVSSVVASRMAGFVGPDAELPAIVAELARLIADPHEPEAMGNAERARATRLHGWQQFVDAAAEVLSRASGSRVASAALRPTLTSA